MRADAHYVDQLTSRADKPAADAPRTAASEPDHRTDLMLAHLTEGIATIESATAILSNETSSIARKVNLDVIRTQTWRASWLLRANAIARGTHRLHVRPRPLAFLLGQLRAGFAAECRLSGIRLDVRASDWNAVVAADEPSLIAGLAGAMFATIDLIEEVEGVTITVNAAAASGELRTVDVTQDDVMVGASASHAFFEPTRSDRSGAWAAGLPAAIARTVAQQHGGDAAFRVTDRGGSTIRLTFSQPG